MLNKIIVESINDKYIFEHLLSITNESSEIEIQQIIDSNLENIKQEVMTRLDYIEDSIILKQIKKILDDNQIADIETISSEQWITLSGLSQSSIELKIKDLRRDILTAPEKPRISIIIDFDTFSVEERIKFLNSAVTNALGTDIKIKNVGIFETFNITEDSVLYDFELSYFFVGKDGKGEIEDLLIEIADLNIAHHAESLKDSWRPHLISNHQIEIKDKDFNKIWIDFYKRYDCLTLKQKNQAGRYVKWDNFLRKHPQKFNFHKDLKDLEELKSFIKTLCK